MKKYYFDFIQEKLKKDIIQTLIDQTIDPLIVEELVTSYLSENEIVFEEIKETSITHKIRDRSAYKNKKNKCIARVWNEGEGGQCSRSGIHCGFCKTHFKKGGHCWWLGTINQPRPERPIYPTSGEVHHWNR